MTLVEFLHPLRNGPVRDIALAAIYYELRYSNTESLTVEELRGFLTRARITKAAKANLADVLAKSAPFVESCGRKGQRLLWSLTSTGQKHVRSLLSLPEAEPEIEHDVSSLEKTASALSDPDVASYVNECILCLKMGALRAAVVFLWSAAVRELQQKVMGKKPIDINSSAVKHDSKARAIKRIDDLEYIKESTLLLIAQDLGILDKSERSVLDEVLNVRNKCGHPGKYSPGPKKVSSVIEDVMGILF